MDTLILRNVGTTDLIINDIGISIAPGEETDLIASFEDEKILESIDLESSLIDAELLLNAVPITYQQLVAYLTKLTRYDKLDYSYVSGQDNDTDITGIELEELTDGSDTSLHSHSSYYTKIELQTPGSSLISWDNLTGVPQFGAVNWKSAVSRTNSSYGSGTTLPISGNEINDARLVSDDSDGRPAQYVCVATIGVWSDQWKKIADIDWGTASYIGVTPNANLTSTNIQSALEELQFDIDTINNSISSITLDSAYDNGSTITVDYSNITFNLTNNRLFEITNGSTVLSVGVSTTFTPVSTNPPIIVVPQVAPTTGLTSGSISNINGMLCIYDSVRSKWLSLETIPYVFTDKSASGKYSAIGDASAANVGILVPMDCIIYGVTAVAGSGNDSKPLEIRINGTSVKTFSLSSFKYTSVIDNINISAGDLIQVFVTASGSIVKDIVTTVYTRWRK